MFREEKNLKDSEKDSFKDTSSTPAVYSNTASPFGSYNKTNKLITALYMVTEIIDTDEPLRNKLRTLATGIISYMHSVRQGRPGETASFMLNKISEIMSFLDIASAIGIISPMNCSILQKEFTELTESIKEANTSIPKVSTQINLSEFFKEELEAPKHGQDSKGHYSSIGHHSNSVGVQKGSTLLKALSRIEVSDKKRLLNFDLLKKERREQILNILKAIGHSATIKDIKDKVRMTPEKAPSLVSCGDKTLQRELVSMVKDGVLNKSGEKRWSKYFIK